MTEVEVADVVDTLYVFLLDGFAGWSGLFESGRYCNVESNTGSSS